MFEEDEAYVTDPGKEQIMKELKNPLMNYRLSRKAFLALATHGVRKQRAPRKN